MLARQAKLKGASKGLVFQLAENLGSLPRKTVKHQINLLTKVDRKQLRNLGIVFGSARVYFPALLKPIPSKILGLLWVLWNAPDTPPETPHPGRVSLLSDEFPTEYLNAIGYQPVGRLALRLDVLERVSTLAWKLGRKGSFVFDAQLQSLTGCRSEDIEIILKEVGFCKLKETDFGIEYVIERKVAKNLPQKNHKKNKPKKNLKVDPDSPFAILRELTWL